MMVQFLVETEGIVYLFSHLVMYLFLSLHTAFVK